MLATMSSSPHGPSTQYTTPHEAYDYAQPDANMEDRICPGCKQSAVSENGGLVVAFGQSFFHVDCFKCAKCGDQVTADTNLLLLSDGSPICANCSYSCNVCHLPILDEAIMTGDDSYHAHCFKCKVCKTRIDELVFAKTSQGIYCMNCHNERMAKIRRHAQKKKEKERERAGGSKSRERGAGEFGTLSPRPEESFTPDSSMRSQSSIANSYNDRSMDRSRQTSSSSQVNERDRSSPASPRAAPKQNSLPLVHDAFEPQAHPPAPTHINITPDTPPRGMKPHKQLSVTVAPPADNGDYSISSGTPSPSRSRFDQSVADTTITSAGDLEEFLQPNQGGSSLQRKKSYDDGTRPLNVLFNKRSKANVKDQAEGLNVPSNGVTPRNEKRRSFQIVHEVNTGSPTHALSPSSPRSPSFAQSLAPIQQSRSPSQSPSPTRDTFPTTTTSPRPMSPQVNSLRSSASQSFHSTASSPTPVDNDRFTNQQALRARSSSASVSPPEHDQRPPLRPSVTLDQVPTSVSGGPMARERVRLSSDATGMAQGRFSPTLGPPNGHSLRMQKSFDDGVRAGSPLRERPGSSSTSDGSRPASGSRSRPTSDSRRADVPHSIESGTDDEAEKEEAAGPRPSVDSVNGPPPALPPKEYEGRSAPLEVDTSSPAPDPNRTLPPDSADAPDDLEEAVETMSIATFVAPALPPIRFSLNSADFSDMLKNVGGGMPSMKALEHLAKMSEEGEASAPTPPPTAAMPLTPTTPASDITVTNDTAKLPTAPKTKVSRKQPPPLMSPETRSSSDGPRPLAIERIASESQPKRPRTADSVMRSKSEAPKAVTNGRPSTNSNSDSGYVTLTPPESNVARPATVDNSDLVVRRLQEAFADATDRGAQQLKLDKGFVEAILTAFDQRSDAFSQLKVKYDGMKRASQQYVDGLSVAQGEYDRELKARRDSEAEVTRLRVLLSGQAARLTAMVGEVKKQEIQQQLSQERGVDLNELEHSLSKLKVERDMTLAEIDELSATRNSPTYADGDIPPAKLGRSLTMRLDNIKTQYQRDLVPLTQQREVLAREISDLKAARDAFLEETTVLNARNEELAQLSAQYARRMEAPVPEPQQTHKLEGPAIIEKKSNSFERSRPQPAPGMQPSVSNSTIASTATLTEDPNMTLRKLPEMSSPAAPRAGKFKWPGTKPRDPISSVLVPDQKAPGRLEHTFQQLSILRFTRCDHCGDKMWGSQLRCSSCNVSVHVRCVNHVQVACAHQPPGGRPEPQGHVAPLPPSMFGRNLAEQVRADARGGDREVPIIVEKCVDAVEALALDYEGIYRKSGGSGQTKAITQLFERGDYNAFDLRDQDQFNDICSITSVLKTYFRSLPIPLLTYDLHEEFINAATMKDQDAKYEALLDTVNKLPNEHYCTLRMLMLHLHNVREQSEVNLMTARNLGVVFGPTLMRSRDPATEFSDMAGKAISIEWLVDNAPIIFAPPPPPH